MKYLHSPTWQWAQYTWTKEHHNEKYSSSAVQLQTPKYKGIGYRWGGYVLKRKTTSQSMYVFYTRKSKSGNCSFPSLDLVLECFALVVLCTVILLRVANWCIFFSLYSSLRPPLKSFTVYRNKGKAFYINGLQNLFILVTHKGGS